ncbi:MAG TPA: DUF1415 domain-containing protein [Cytophagales bacterium]|nr:DUF1415 domain-containing protein [Cytophagales bacterium]
MEDQSESIIVQTRKWILDVVVGLNLCPFAAKEVKSDRVRYVVLKESEPEVCLHALLEECELLDADASIETTLIIIPYAFEDFETYLDLVDYAEAILEQHDYEGIYQVASFHPEYRFADSDVDDPANYTNRSPYPMLHLLRESSIDIALTRYPDHEEIPERNISLTRQKGLAYMKMLREACLSSPHTS